MLVKVKNIPVRYERKTYNVGQSFEIREEHLEGIRNFVDVIKEKPKSIEDMTVAELKEYAAGQGIDLGEATRKPDILIAIQIAQKQE